MRIILVALHKIVLELILARQHWKKVIRTIPTILNFADSKRLGCIEDAMLR